MPETLLSPTGIKLYGRPVTDLTVNHSSSGPGDNSFLRKQLMTTAAGNKANLARIYAFSFEGHHYDLPKAAIFLVHGPGTVINYPTAGRTSDVESSGVAAKEWEFSFGDL